MGPLRQVTVLLHLGTVVLLTQGAVFSWQRCADKRQYFDETRGACNECRPCLKVSPTWDPVVIMDECEQKNPNVSYTNNKTGEEFYHWCNVESGAYIKWLRSLETTTTAKSTMDAVHLKTTIGSTSVTEITQPTTSPQPQEYTKPIGSNVSLALGFGITAGLLFCFLLVIIAIWYRYRRGSPSETSSITNSTRASNSSIDEEKSLISPVGGRPDPIPSAPTVHHERALNASGFQPIKISPHPVVEGGPLLLTVYHHCIHCEAFWEHVPTQTKYFHRVDIAIVSPYHEGQYNVELFCSGKKHWSGYEVIYVERVSTLASNSPSIEEIMVPNPTWPEPLVRENLLPILPAPTVHERAIGASGFHPIKKSPDPVVEGGPLLLTVDLHCLNCVAIWEHVCTQTKYFDEVDINIVSRYHEGRYNVVLCCLGKKLWSNFIDISIERVRENAQPGNNQPVESSDDSSRLELAVRTESSIVPWMGATVMQPSTDYDGSSQLVPSSQSHHTLMQHTIHMVSGIDTSPPTREAPRPDGRCLLLIRELINNEDAMFQLAILFDPTHMTRLFAALEGDMTPVQIDYVEAQAKGSGNTVKAVFKFIIDRKRNDLTAYDFLDFMWRKEWQCGRVITLLYSLHTDCPKCGDLYRRGGENSPVEFGPTPGIEYHRINEFNHCAQTLKSLAKGNEEFRQESTVLFEKKIWRHIGSHLGGMTQDLLQYIELHNRGHINRSCYRDMLDRLVTVYPYLKVGTLIQWLLDHRWKDEADLVLKFHMKTDCTFCRSYEGSVAREDSAL